MRLCGGGTGDPGSGQDSHAYDVCDQGHMAECLESNPRGQVPLTGCGNLSDFIFLCLAFLIENEDKDQQNMC